MTANEETALRMEKIADKLFKQAAELCAGINRNKCVHGEYTEEPFNTHGCKACGKPTVVICSYSKVVGKRRNSKGCNALSCKYFEHLTLNT